MRWFKAGKSWSIPIEWLLFHHLMGWKEMCSHGNGLPSIWTLLVIMVSICFICEGGKLLYFSEVGWASFHWSGSTLGAKCGGVKVFPPPNVSVLRLLSHMASLQWIMPFLWWRAGLLLILFHWLSSHCAPSAKYLCSHF